MRRIEVVIIAHNEGEYALKMIGSIPSWPIHYIADRCTDGTQDCLSIYDKIDLVDTTDMGLTGRQTSFCRNLGLSRCHPDSDVLFLDGDRYPVSGSLLNAIESCETDILCLKVFFDTRRTADFQENYGKMDNGFFSCGIFFRRNAINAIQEYQDGELFNTSLQSEWGIEDTSLGDLAYHLSLTASLSDKVKLRGGFDKTRLDSLDALEKRLRFRENLSVKWKG